MGRLAGRSMWWLLLHSPSLSFPINESHLSMQLLWLILLSYLTQSYRDVMNMLPWSCRALPDLTASHPPSLLSACPATPWSMRTSHHDHTLRPEQSYHIISHLHLTIQVFFLIKRIQDLISSRPRQTASSSPLIWSHVTTFHLLFFSSLHFD